MSVSGKKDISDKSIVLEFIGAKARADFSSYVNIGDWVFYLMSTRPTLATASDDDLKVTLARLSYYTCYRMLGKSWALYEELADNFTNISNQVHSKLYTK